MTEEMNQIKSRLKSLEDAFEHLCDQLRVKGVISCLVVSLVLFAMPFAHAQQYSCYGCPQVGNPQSNQQSNGVEWQILKEIETFFSQVLSLGHVQDQDLKTIIQNQQTEINLLQQMVRQK